MDKVKLEHTEYDLYCHDKQKCIGENCTVHNRSNHSMRSFPQNWRGDRAIMERICPHGIGHPDPDDFKTKNWSEFIHGCDGCCEGAYDEIMTNKIEKDDAWLNGKWDRVPTESWSYMEALNGKDGEQE